MDEQASETDAAGARSNYFLEAPAPRSFMNFIGRKFFRMLLTVQGLGAFGLITLGVMVRKLQTARWVTVPLAYQELARSGVRLFPMFIFVSAALGLVVIGQTVAWASKVGATQFIGPVMVVVVVRELGPMITALLTLARSGTTNVIELGTARALGEVEALEALGIDPIHYLVAPRVLGMAVGIPALTVYLVIGSLVSGYVWAFLQDVPLRPAEYFNQLAKALTALDFVTLALKCALFGAAIAVITCYHGLAQPLRLDEISRATVRAVAQSVVACVLIDALFILLYLEA